MIKKTDTKPARSQSEIALRKRRFTILIALLLIAACGYGYQSYWRPYQLFQQAKNVSSNNFKVSERLLEDAIIAAGGSYPEAELFRATILGSHGFWDEAMGAFSLIEDKEKLNSNKVITLGELAAGSGQVHLARNCFKAALKSAPEANVYRHLIRLELSVGNEDRARTYCQQLLSIDAEDPTAWQVLGTVAMRQMEPTVARDAFRKALSLGVAEASLVREDLVQVLIDNGEYDGARTELKKLKSEGPLTVRASLEDAYLLRLSGESQQALVVTEQLIESNNPPPLPAILLAGILNLDLAHLEIAVAFLKQVVEVQPHNKEAHFKLALAYRQLDQDEQAKEHLSQSQYLTDQAITLLEVIESLEQNPGNEDLRNQAIELYDSLGKKEEAERLRRIR